MDIYLPTDFRTLRAAEKYYAANHYEQNFRASWTGAETLLTRALYALRSMCKLTDRRRMDTEIDPTWQVL